MKNVVRLLICLLNLFSITLLAFAVQFELLLTLKVCAFWVGIYLINGIVSQIKDFVDEHISKSRYSIRIVSDGNVVEFPRKSQDV